MQKENTADFFQRLGRTKLSEEEFIKKIDQMIVKYTTQVITDLQKTYNVDTELSNMEIYYKIKEL